MLLRNGSVPGRLNAFELKTGEHKYNDAWPHVKVISASDQDGKPGSGIQTFPTLGFSLKVPSDVKSQPGEILLARHPRSMLDEESIGVKASVQHLV
jgi:hypothetical protein